MILQRKPNEILGSDANSDGTRDEMVIQSNHFLRIRFKMLQEVCRNRLTVSRFSNILAVLTN